MNFLNGVITEKDIDIIRQTSVKPVNFAEIVSHEYFSVPIQLIKLTSILSVLRDREKIAKIVEAVGERSDLRNPAALEILLLSGGPTVKAGDDLPNELAACINLYFSIEPCRVNSLNEISALCKLQLIKHAALNGKGSLVAFIYQNSSAEERSLFVDFHLSLARFAAQYFDRLSVKVEHEQWIRYCKIIAEKLCKSSPGAQSVAFACVALLTANNGDLAEADRIIRKNKVEDKILRYSIPMQRALRRGDHAAAIKFADQLLPFCSPGLKDVGFSREIAEHALCRISAILKREGLQPFLISGTLLGFVREGRIFEHDKDFDIGIIGWENQYNVAAALLNSGEFLFSAKDLRGSNLFLLPVRHVPTGFDFDIFFFHDRGSYFLHGIDSRIGYTLNYKFSKFDLTVKNFIGMDFFIPSDYRKMLAENYGEKWEIPDPNYFVKLQSPALDGVGDHLAAFVARHEMIDLIQRRGSRKKGELLIECIRAIVKSELQPTQGIIEKFFAILDKNTS